MTSIIIKDSKGNIQEVLWVQANASITLGSYNHCQVKLAGLDIPSRLEFMQKDKTPITVSSDICFQLRNGCRVSRITLKQRTLARLGTYSLEFRRSSLPTLKVVNALTGIVETVLYESRATCTLGSADFANIHVKHYLVSPIALVVKVSDSGCTLRSVGRIIQGVINDKPFETANLEYGQTFGLGTSKFRIEPALQL